MRSVFSQNFFAFMNP